VLALCCDGCSVVPLTYGRHVCLRTRPLCAFGARFERVVCSFHHVDVTAWLNHEAAHVTEPAFREDNVLSRIVRHRLPRWEIARCPRCTVVGGAFWSRAVPVRISQGHGGCALSQSSMLQVTKGRGKKHPFICAVKPTLQIIPLAPEFRLFTPSDQCRYSCHVH
jgi:hypothetical protein